jgi:O-Antigen ligase
MGLIRTSLGRIFIPAGRQSSLVEGLLVLAGAFTIAFFILLPEAGFVAIITCAALWFLVLMAQALQGRFEAIVICWAALFPFSYHLAFPSFSHAIVDLDRLVVLAAFLGMIFSKPSAPFAIPKRMRSAGLLWAAFGVAACASISKSPSFLNGARVAFDSVLLPLLLAWCVIARFDVRRWLPGIHTAACISAIISAAVAAAQIITGETLLQLADTAVYYYEGRIVRPAGLFEQNDTLALIGGVSLFFLLFLRNILGPQVSSARKLLHWIGLLAATGMVLMPMFRSVALTLLLVLIIDTFWERGTTRRAWRVALICALVGLVLLISIWVPELYQDRSSSENVYGRVAQFRQSYEVFVNNPLLGVGFLNFHNFVAGNPSYFASYRGALAPDWPHDNLAQILTETGILGFVPYLMTHLVLLRAMWQLRQFSSSGYLAWKYFVYFFLTYWIPGLTQSSGFGQLNLWYIFAIAVVYKYVLTAPDIISPEEEGVPARVWGAPADAPMPFYQ